MGDEELSANNVQKEGSPEKLLRELGRRAGQGREPGKGIVLSSGSFCLNTEGALE